MPITPIPTQATPVRRAQAYVPLATAAAPGRRGQAPVGDLARFSGALGNARFASLAGLARVARGGGVLGAEDKAAVRAVQEALDAMAFYTPASSRGVLDKATGQAIKNFQAACGLPKTGQLDAATLAQLDAVAPAPGMKAWDAGQPRGPVPDPVVRDAKGAPVLRNGQPVIARIVVGIGQHRVFRFDAQGKLQTIYPCRTGTPTHADGRGNRTMPAVKVIDAKMSGQALRDLGATKWNQPGAFGDALLALSKVDPATGAKLPFSYNGQELHGVPNNAKGEPTGLGADFSHGCVGMKNADIKEIAGFVRSGDVVDFRP